MPFKKLGNGRYQGPTGKIFNEKQVQLYYSNGQKFPGQKKASIEKDRKYKLKK